MISAILLPHTDPTVLQRTVDVLRLAQVHDLVLLADPGSPGPGALAASLSVTPAPDGAPGELARIGQGIRACRQADLDGVLIVSAPPAGSLSHGLIVDLLRQFWVSQKAIVASRGGEFHIIAASLFTAVQTSSPGDTLKAFIARHAGEVHLASPPGEEASAKVGP